jgi:hypothetical protein
MKGRPDYLSARDGEPSFGTTGKTRILKIIGLSGSTSILPKPIEPPMPIMQSDFVQQSRISLFSPLAGF